MEQPNLNYINQLSGENSDFKSRMIAIIKRELPEEVESYLLAIRKENFKLTADCVHKLKHKIAVLGLEKSYYIAEKFEDDLKDNNLNLQPQFEEILTQMQHFVSEL